MEVLHYRGPAAPDNARWTGGSGYLIGARLVLTAAHNVDYRQELGDDEQLLVRTIAGSLWATQVVLIGDESSQVDLALLEISDPRFDQYLPPVSFARVNRDSPAPLSDCWAVGFPRFGEAGPVLPEGSHKETWQVLGDILPGTKLRAGLLSLQVTSKPSPAPLAGSEWEGMSGALVFATDPDDGQQAIAVVIMHHLPEGESALTLVPITAINGLSTAARWWQQLGIGDPDALPVRPPPSAADQQRSRLTGKLALKEHWDPRGRGVEHRVRPGWFFTGRRQALSQLVAWVTAAPTPADNVRVVTGGPGSGKSAVLARLVTMSDPEYRARMPRPLAPGDPVADLAPGAIDVAVHARTALAGEVVSALAYAAGAPQADLDGLIDRLLERREAFTIAVDALDEADDPPELAQKLRKLASETADAGVRLLVGTRPGGPDRRLITTLGLSARGDDSALIDLDDPRYLSREDLADYVRRRLLLTDIPPDPGWPDTPYRGREALAGQVAAAVASAAYPAFLVGQLVSRALVQRSQPLSPHDPGWQQFPKTVAGAMDQYLASVGDQNKQGRVEDLLRPLAYARGDGLPLDEDAGLWPRLATALAEPARRYTVGDVAALLDTAADYLVETVVTGQAAYYRLYHQALSDRIRERYEQHLRPVSAAQTVYQCLLDTVARRPDGAPDWPTAHPYLLSQLAGHAADAGQLTGLLEDPGFLLHADLRRLIPLADYATLASEVVSTLSEAGRQRARLLRLTPRAITADPATRTAMFSVSETLENLGHTYTTSDFPAPYRAIWATATPQTERSLLEGHTDSVNAACSFTLNGRTLLASGGDDRVVRIWDPAAGAEHAVLPGHTGQVRAVCAFTLDNRPLLASGSDDRTVRIWDPDTRAEHAALPGHTDGVIAVCAFTLDDRPLLASGSYDGTVRIWDPAAGAEHAVLRGHTGWVRAVCAFTQDDRVLLASGSADGTVRIWDPATGTEHAVLPGHTSGAIAVCAFTQDDRPLLASAGDDGVVRIRDPATDTEHAPLRGHTGQVRAVCDFTEDDRVLLASGSADGTVRIWDPATGAEHAPPQGHTSRVRAVCAFTRDDRALLASGGDDGVVRIRDPATGAEHATLPGHTGGVNAVCAFAQDDRVLLASGSDDRTVRIWDPAASIERAVLQGHTGWVRAVCAFTQDRVLLASGSYDRTVRIWDPATGAKHAVLPGLTGQVRAVCAFTQDGRALLASGGDDGMLRIRDPATRAEHAVLPGHTGWVNAVCAFTKDDRVLLASGSDDRTVRIWDPATGAKHAVLPGHTRGVNAVCAFTQDGRALLASGSDDRTVRIWDPMTTTALLTVPVHHPVWAVSYATDVLVVAVAAGLLAIQFNLAVGKL